MILSPTRELARQTQTVMVALGDRLQVESYLVVGGERVSDMRQRLNSGIQVIVGKSHTSTSGIAAPKSVCLTHSC